MGVSGILLGVRCRECLFGGVGCEFWFCPFASSSNHSGLLCPADLSLVRILIFLRCLAVYPCPPSRHQCLCVTVFCGVNRCVPALRPPPSSWEHLCLSLVCSIGVSSPLFLDVSLPVGCCTLTAVLLVHRRPKVAINFPGSINCTQPFTLSPWSQPY